MGMFSPQCPFCPWCSMQWHCRKLSSQADASRWTLGWSKQNGMFCGNESLKCGNTKAGSGRHCSPPAGWRSVLDIHRQFLLLWTSFHSENSILHFLRCDYHWIRSQAIVHASRKTLCLNAPVLWCVHETDPHRGRQPHCQSLQDTASDERKCGSWGLPWPLTHSSGRADFVMI